MPPISRPKWREKSFPPVLSLQNHEPTCNGHSPTSAPAVSERGRRWKHPSRVSARSLYLQDKHHTTEIRRGSRCCTFGRSFSRRVRQKLVGQNWGSVVCWSKRAPRRGSGRPQNMLGQGGEGSNVFEARTKLGCGSTVEASTQNAIPVPIIAYLGVGTGMQIAICRHLSPW
jgi:hypothetical protein